MRRLVSLCCLYVKVGPSFYHVVTFAVTWFMLFDMNTWLLPPFCRFIQLVITWYGHYLTDPGGDAAPSCNSRGFCNRFIRFLSKRQHALLCCFPSNKTKHARRCTWVL